MLETCKNGSLIICVTANACSVGTRGSGEVISFKLVIEGTKGTYNVHWVAPLAQVRRQGDRLEVGRGLEEVSVWAYAEAARIAAKAIFLTNIIDKRCGEGVKR